MADHHGEIINDFSWETVQVFQIIEQSAELDKMSTQKALLIMERKMFLDNLANASYNYSVNQQVVPWDLEMSLNLS